MSGFGYDQHDAEWEHGDGLRTTYVSGLDDGFCEVCDEANDDGCSCEEGEA